MLCFCTTFPVILLPLETPLGFKIKFCGFRQCLAVPHYCKERRSSRVCHIKIKTCRQAFFIFLFFTKFDVSDCSVLIIGEIQETVQASSSLSMTAAQFGLHQHVCCVMSVLYFSYNLKPVCSPFTRSDFPWCLSSSPSSRK